jgi:hemoglobin/transferrin/lactoferrin receptor protein
MMKFFYTAGIILSQFAALFAQEKAQISGQILDGKTNKGLAGIQIRISSQEEISEGAWSPYSAVSDLDGSYYIGNLDSGYYYLHASAIGYSAVTKELYINPGEKRSFNLQMEESLIPLGEVSVTALHTERMVRNVPLPLAVISTARIDQQSWTGVPDILASQPGVTLARDGIWASSVNIRGLSEQRLVTLVDGNRIETATDVAGALSMVDVNDIERIEIVKGAASAIYGTGAMGGIINIHTRGGEYSSSTYLRGRSSVAWNSVNNQPVAGLSLNAGSAKWYMKISGNYRQADNTRTPSGELLNSQFRDNNLAAVLAIRPAANKEFKLDYHRFHAWDVGIPGGKAFPATATASYSRADRQMLSASYTGWNLLPSLTKLQARYYIQNIVREVDLHPNQNVTIQPIGEHLTNGLQLQSDWEPAYNHQLIAGVDVWQRYLTTSREKTVLVKLNDSITNTKVFGEVPIPASSFTNFGMYLQDEWNVIPGKLKLMAGARGDNVTVHSEQAIDPAYIILNGVRNDAPAGQRITFEAASDDDFSWSANAGLLYTLPWGPDVSFSLARGHRSPSLEERFKYIDLGASVRLGNPSLKPEQGWFYDLGIRLWNTSFNLVIDGYANYMSNLIVEDSGIFVYNYTADETLFDTVPALINSNVEKALLYGSDLSFNWICMKNLVLSGSLGLVYGTDRITEKPLPQIPPINGSMTLRYTIPGWASVFATSRFASKQDRLGAGESSTGGYAIYDAGFHTPPIGWKKMKIEFTQGIENIFNRSYRLHLATNRGVIRDEPGRNLYIRMNVLF